MRFMTIPERIGSLEHTRITDKASLDAFADQLNEVRCLISAQPSALDPRSAIRLQSLHDQWSHNLSPEFKAENARISQLFKEIVQISPPTPKNESSQTLGATGSYAANVPIGPPRPVCSNELDPVMAELWVAAHSSPEAKSAARAALQAIKHISQKEFEETLHSCVLRFNEQLTPGTEYWTISWANKSNQWAFGLALPHLTTPPSRILERDLAYATLDRSFKLALSHSTPQALVLFDDGIYSGIQMQGIIGELSQLFLSHNMAVPPIYVVCAYATKVGQEFVQKTRGINVKLIIGQEIPSFWEQILKQKNGNAHWHTIRQMGGVGDVGDIRGVGSYYFDHKVPDYMSFPCFITDGLVRSINGACESKRYQIIPATTPPYKKFS